MDARSKTLGLIVLTALTQGNNYNMQQAGERVSGRNFFSSLCPFVLCAYVRACVASVSPPATPSAQGIVRVLCKLLTDSQVAPVAALTLSMLCFEHGPNQLQGQSGILSLLFHLQNEHLNLQVPANQALWVLFSLCFFLSFFLFFSAWRMGQTGSISEMASKRRELEREGGRASLLVPLFFLPRSP